jgi:thymidylate synthase ThyX
VSPPRPAHESVTLVEATPEADRRLVASLLFGSTARSYAECWRRAGEMTAAEREDFVKAALRRMESWHAPQREFEHVSASFELIVSAACFAQLKRHRMATLTAQPYDPTLGVTVPASVREAGMESAFLEETARASALHDALAPLGPAAAYALTNAHRRRVLFTANARELYHLSRLREDEHAQWDIRAIASRAIEEARRVMPLTLLLAAGKDRFGARRAEVFGG